MPQRIMRSCAMKARLNAVDIAKLPELYASLNGRVGFNPSVHPHVPVLARGTLVFCSALYLRRDRRETLR
jgi:hypothetical protein